MNKRAHRNNRQKIYIIGPSFKTQGGISSVLKLYRSNYAARFNMVFIPSYSGFGRHKDLLLFSAALARVFLACLVEKAPVFHIHVASRGSFLRKSMIAGICRLFDKKIIFHIHGAMFDRFIEDSPPRKKEKILGCLKAADKVVVLSHKWKDFFAKYLPEDKISVVYNPTPTYRPEYIPRSNPRPVIIFMGRLGKRKGTYDLIEAAKLIKAKEFLLRLYGDGDVEEVKALIETEGLKERISVNNWVEHSRVEAIYEGADLLVLPSYAEGLPMSVLEAIGKGLPVVSTEVGGIPEAVEDGHSGFILEPGDVAGLAERMGRLVEDAGLREAMGKAGLKLAGDKFSIGSVGKQLERLYSELETGGAGHVQA